MTDLQPFENRSADHLRLVLDATQIGIWELDLNSGLAVRNETHDRIFGYEEPLVQWSYERFLEHVVPSDRARVDRLQKTAIEENREWAFECQVKTASGEFRWIKAAGRPLRDADGNVARLIGHVIDVTEVKQNEARLRLLTEELNHRVRNMLSMVRSMVKMTARTTSDMPAFIEALEGRVRALTRSHELVMGEFSASRMPSEILRAELTAFRGLEDQIHISLKDEKALSASAAQGLTLVFHELLTNAIKHGALAVEDGRVEVGIASRENTTRIRWLERGGPPLPKHRGTGFGSRLISSALAADGTTEQIFRAEGLECLITLNNND